MKQSEENKLQSIKEWTEKNNTLTAANEEKEKEIDDLKKQCQAACDNVTQYENVNASLEGEITTLKSKLTVHIIIVLLTVIKLFSSRNNRLNMKLLQKNSRQLLIT